MIFKNYLNYKSINSFNLYNKNENDKLNKIREIIIFSIINKLIPNKYYLLSNRWNLLRKNIDEFIKNLNPIIIIDNILCKLLAGRNNNYDFEIILNNIYIYKIEFKFNSNKINKIPQFVSPMKPSIYLSSSFENFIYNNYLNKLLSKYNLILPLENDYYKQIHSPNPKCLKDIQEKYYKGCSKSSKYSNLKDDINFYKEANEYSKQAIIKFIENNELNIDKLSNYLLNSQKNKIYMLYYNNNIYKETIENDNFIINSYIKNKNYYLANTKSGIKLKILLRWKNGNLIAYPAFQISIIGNK